MPRRRACSRRGSSCPGVAEQLAEFSASVAGLDLVRLGTTADADEIKDTAVTQPLIVALGARRGPRARPRGGTTSWSSSPGTASASSPPPPSPARCQPRSAVAFAARRGAEMAAACALAPTGMSAVLGGDPDEVVAGIEAAGLTAGQPQRRRPDRRRRRPGRAGEARRRAAGRRAGAPACRSPAPSTPTTWRRPRTRSRAFADATCASRDPRPILLSNADGAGGHDRRRAARPAGRGRSPARCAGTCACARCADLGVTAAIELAAGRHAGRHRQARAARRRAGRGQDPGRPRRGPRAHRRAAPSTGRASTPSTSGWSSTPAKGVFTRPRASTRASAVARGTPLGTVRTNRDEHADRRATQAGVLVEWLRDDGDIVAAGLPVARLHNGAEL